MSGSIEEIADWWRRRGNKRGLEREPTCAGCGHPWYPDMGACNVCYQRALRLRHRHKKIVCTICAATFTTTRADARFCSPACRQKAHRAKQFSTKKIVCTICAIAFTSTRAHARFCSHACRQKAHRAERANASEKGETHGYYTVGTEG